MTQLDDSLALTHLAEGRFSACADPRYEANSGMFGGWTAALMIRAVAQDSRASGNCSFLSLQYLNMIAPGAMLTLTTHPVGGSKSIMAWQVDVTSEGADTPSAIATVIMTHRRESNTHTEPRMPDAPIPESLPPFSPPGKFGHIVQNRLTRGVPFAGGDTISHGWVREMSGRSMDAAQLAFLSDVYAPRIFHISAAPRPSSTVALTLTILAGPDELASVGDDWILSDVAGTRIEQSQVGSSARFWSRDGKLLATGEQLCWFR